MGINIWWPSILMTGSFSVSLTQYSCSNQIKRIKIIYHVPRNLILCTSIRLIIYHYYGGDRLPKKFRVRVLVRHYILSLIKKSYYGRADGLYEKFRVRVSMRHCII